MRFSLAYPQAIPRSFTVDELTEKSSNPGIHRASIIILFSNLIVKKKL